MAELTGYDRQLIGEARELAGLSGADAIRAYTGETSPGLACAVAFGRAQARLDDLLRLIGHLAGEDLKPGL